MECAKKKKLRKKEVDVVQSTMSQHPRLHRTVSRCHITKLRFLFTYGNDVCSSLWIWSGWANEVGAYKMFVSYFRKTTHSHPHPHRYLRKSISIMHTNSASSLLHGCRLSWKNPLEAETLFFLIKLLFLSQFFFGFGTTREWTSFVSNFNFHSPSVGAGKYFLLIFYGEVSVGSINKYSWEKIHGKKRNSDGNYVSFGLRKLFFFFGFVN